MENKRLNILLNNEGQSTVEYLLLLVVVTSFAMLVFKSKAFNDMVGQGMFDTLARSMEYTARFGDNGTQQIQGNLNGPAHPLYYDPTGSRSRFFSPNEAYSEE